MRRSEVVLSYTWQPTPLKPWVIQSWDERCTYVAWCDSWQECRRWLADRGYRPRAHGGWTHPSGTLKL